MNPLKTHCAGRARSAVALAMAAVFAAAAGFGSSTQVWEISDYKDFAAGQFENISLSPEGSLTLAPALDAVFSSDQPVIWSLASAPDGTVYLGTGHQGRVYRVAPDGASKLFWSAPEIEVFCLALSADGTLYAGTSPNGKIYRIDRDGNGEVFFDPKQSYIWSIVLTGEDESDKNLWRMYAGTGEDGKIFEINRGGDGEVYFDTGQRHVISLALDGEGRVLAGTDPNGLLYRIDRKGKAFVLYDADLPEIRSLQVASNGDIYAAAIGGAVSQMVSSATTAAASAAKPETISISVKTGPGENPGAPEKPGGGSATQTLKPEPMPVVTISQPAVSYAGVEKSAVLRLRPGRAADKLWSSNEADILALQFADTDQRELLFATDQKGQIYRLDGERRASLLTTTDQEQVTQIAAAGKALLAATAHSGKLYRLGGEAAPSGVYETGVRDAKAVARWGQLSWRGNLPGGSKVEFQARSGNSGRPDSTWSDWSAAGEWTAGGMGSAAVDSPAARYVQWRAKFERGGGEAPVLRSVRVTYLPQNSPPVVRSIDVSTSVSPQPAAGAAGSSASSDTSAAFSITVTDTGDVSTANPATGTRQQTVGAGTEQKLTVTWAAEDPDGDALLSGLEFRGEDETTWKAIKDRLDERSFVIDSQSLADGIYRFRVRVSDRKSNPAELALRAERTSEPVLVDHTPPAVRMAGVEGRARVRFEAEDAASILQSAEYSIDAGDWSPVYPEDGIIDSQRETFSITLGELAPGERLVTLRVRDRAGNAGLAKAVVR